MLALAGAESELTRFAMLFLFSYSFLLRLPSEALPVRFQCGAYSISVADGKVVLNLAKRKNKPMGSTLTRTCWCKSRDGEMCPVHVFGDWAKKHAEGELLFNASRRQVHWGA